MGRVDQCSRLTLQLESEVAETLKEHAELEQQCLELDKVRKHLNSDLKKVSISRVA
jgi:hypothetical protein